MSAVQLRRATWRDIETLTTLDAALFGHEAWSNQTWWSEFAARPRRRYVVATSPDDEGQILGYAGLDVAGTTADVMTIAVVEQARGRGLGGQLLTWLVETARAADAEALMLEVRADNDAALALYGRFGFDRLTVRRRYYQPDDVDAVIMRLLLNQPLEASS